MIIAVFYHKKGTFRTRGANVSHDACVSPVCGKILLNQELQVFGREKENFGIRETRLFNLRRRQKTTDAMKSKYDIARLHKDCLAWCENPQWKPWMIDDYKLKYVRSERDHCIRDVENIAVIDSVNPTTDVLLFGHIIGLDVESYRLPEIDRDQAVRDYLDKIEEGAPLWEGSEWVKGSDEYGVGMKINGGLYYFIHKNGDIDPLAYTFLRLDLKEVDNG